MPTQAATAERWNLKNSAIIGLPHPAAVAALGFIYYFPISWGIIIFTVVLFLLIHFGISCGYHRLITHKAYEATEALRIFLLICAAGAFQHSAIWWEAVHSRHHKYSESEKDPHNIKKGLKYAHIIWLLVINPNTNRISGVQGSRNDKLLKLQHQYIWYLSFFVSFGIPIIAGYYLFDNVLGTIAANVVRVVVQWHTTWTINSITHMRFKLKKWFRVTLVYRPTNWSLLSPFTAGEADHENHHNAEEDYRIGRYWYNLDLGKWFIYLCSLVGLAYDLKRVSEEDFQRNKRLSDEKYEMELAKAA